MNYSFNQSEISLFNNQFNTDYNNTELQKILINKLTDCQFNTDDQIIKFCLSFYNISETDLELGTECIKHMADIIFDNNDNLSKKEKEFKKEWIKEFLDIWKEFTKEEIKKVIQTGR